MPKKLGDYETVHKLNEAAAEVASVLYEDVEDACRVLDAAGISNTLTYADITWRQYAKVFRYLAHELDKRDKEE